MTPTKIQ